ncbi:MAG: GNAT family N-acetyltransferase [Rhodobacter sp.]|nr:GNAT family N-acetyltransferase [Rhodobacter sp.]
MPETQRDNANAVMGPPISLRPAGPDDADLLVRVIDLASDGVLPAIWAGLAPEGVDPAEVGRAMVLAEDGPFSYRSGWVIETPAAPLGGMIGYALPDPPVPPEPDVPPVFVPVEELVAQVPGYWLINMVAVLPEVQRRGLGAALVAKAEALAQASEAPGVALIVAASNAAAIRLYTRAGFQETGRCPMDAREFGHPLTEAVLMTKKV